MDNPDRSVRVVCHANICRSALAQFRIAKSIAFLTWDVQSRGTHADDGMHLCPEVAASVVADRGQHAFVQGFRSHRLTDEDLAAGIILTASAEEKSAIALRDPSTRRRTFTLIEAAALAAGGVQRLAAAPPTAAELARVLDELRRTGALPAERGGSSLDIPEAHVTKRVRHAKTLRAVVAASERLSAALIEAWGEPEVATTR